MSKYSKKAGVELPKMALPMKLRSIEEAPHVIRRSYAAGKRLVLAQAEFEEKATYARQAHLQSCQRKRDKHIETRRAYMIKNVILGGAT